MIAECDDGQMVYESHGMGRKWTEAAGTLSGVWVNARSGVSWDERLRAEALITATMEGRRVMLCTQGGYVSREKNANALHLWVTDSNRAFRVGPLFVENAVNGEVAGTLLYSDDVLRLLQDGAIGASRAISLARVTEELQTIRSALTTWGQPDAFLLRVAHTHGWSGWIPVQRGQWWRDVDRRVPLRGCKAHECREGPGWV
ncbi:trans-sialidase, putative [Trypanosoma cruzi marinkellei]|uniref:Trans-sialidase, putative n=1 Tax=Trypanosoma cruzi marinkellei TaxID=85056 RepID=K2NMB7_TRYCR|nr:trans-sialidase, putative [Trypanosoma cruzi marinkellei]